MKKLSKRTLQYDGGSCDLTPKRRPGRPATGRTTAVIRVPLALIDAVRKLINEFNGGKK